MYKQAYTSAEPRKDACQISGNVGGLLDRSSWVTVRKLNPEDLVWAHSLWLPRACCNAVCFDPTSSEATWAVTRPAKMFCMKKMSPLQSFHTGSKAAQPISRQPKIFAFLQMVCSWPFFLAP